MRKLNEKKFKELSAGEQIFVLSNLNNFKNGDHIKLVRYSPKIHKYIIIYYQFNKAEFINFK